MLLIPSESLPQFKLGSFQYVFLFFSEIRAGPVNVKAEHRHGGLVGSALAALAGFG